MLLQNCGGLVINKSLEDYDPETGKGMINLEAFVTGNVTTSYKSLPLDIVLVLDQSGSMADPFGTEEDYQKLQNASNNQAKGYADEGNLYFWTDEGYKKVTVEAESKYSKYVVSEWYGETHSPTYEDLYEARSDLYYYDNETQQHYLITVTRKRDNRRSDWKYTVTYTKGNQTITIGQANQEGSTKFPEDIYQISTSTLTFADKEN